ncbi:hypothetical protein [Candidatus Pelagibacter sp.]|uniref:hypothetical protein n=1 Tax=Candidatus Pelagibacter sp. TaxID=2024849 RepID=UPI003F8570C3
MIRVFFYYTKLSLIIFFTTFILILFIDFFFGSAILRHLDPYLSKTQFYERLIRVDHPVYHHGFRENVVYNKAKNFSGFFSLCTDNHGFKYHCNKSREKKFDFAFIGDSFVEGVGLPYKDTFTGIYEENSKKSVANLGVTSYGTNIYLSKINFLLNNEYHFDHVVVFIDISDLYDDNTFYLLNDDLSVWEKKAKEKNLKRRKFLRYNFPLTNYYMYVIKMNNRINKESPPLKSLKPVYTSKANLKAEWTYNLQDNINGYDEPITKTKKEMINNIEKLYTLLKKNNIKMSLVVYPWPQTLKNDTINSSHVKMWEEFCFNKCEKFINFFPFFFNEKKKSSYLNVVKKFYFWNDVHFNKKGNSILAKKLIEFF